MKHHHVATNGWSDIGQNFSIFPDGTIMTGRPFNTTPACILGNNGRAICIENVGDFDSWRDTMTANHRDGLNGPGTQFGVMEVQQPGFQVYVRQEQAGWSRIGPSLWANSTLITRD